MKSSKDLRNLLDTIDHRGYPAYKETAGAWRFDNYVLGIDHVQGDPFAAPSRLHVEVPANVTLVPYLRGSEEHKSKVLIRGL